MTNKVWAEVDRYFNDQLLEEDRILEGTLEANAKADLPAIDVSPSQGKLLYLMARKKAIPLIFHGRSNYPRQER